MCVCVCGLWRGRIESERAILFPDDYPPTSNRSPPFWRRRWRPQKQYTPPTTTTSNVARARRTYTTHAWPTVTPTGWPTRTQTVIVVCTKAFNSPSPRLVHLIENEWLWRYICRHRASFVVSCTVQRFSRRRSTHSIVLPKQNCYICSNDSSSTLYTNAYDTTPAVPLRCLRQIMQNIQTDW